MSVYRSTRARAQAASFGLAVCAGATATSALALGRLQWRLSETPGDARLVAVLRESEGMLDFVAQLQLLGWLCTIATAVFFCRWLYRAYENLPALMPGDARFASTELLQSTPGDAVLGFFIPFVNLVRPYRALAEVWRQSAPDGQYHHEVRLVAAWWGLWLCGGFAQVVAYQLLGDVGGVRALVDTLWIALAGELFMLGAALAAIRMVQRIEQRQQARADYVAALAPGRLDPDR